MVALAFGVQLLQFAVVGSIIVLMRDMRLTGNPPAFAWLRMSASFSAS